MIPVDPQASHRMGGRQAAHPPSIAPAPEALEAIGDDVVAALAEVDAQRDAMRLVLCDLAAFFRQSADARVLLTAARPGLHRRLLAVIAEGS